MEHTFTDKRSSPSQPTSSQRTSGSQAAEQSSRRGCASGCEKNVGERERWASLYGGALLALMGASRGGLSGMAVVGVASSLLYRGLTGHCYGYDLLGVNTAKPSEPKEQTSSLAFPAEQDM